MKRAGGFTLLEVIIALLIAGLATAALLQAAGSGLRATREAALYDQATVRAKSHLAAATSGTRLAAGEWEGDDGGGFRWQLRVSPISTATVRPVGIIGPRAAASIPVVLYGVAVSVSWLDGGRTRVVTLQTERVGG